MGKNILLKYFLNDFMRRSVTAEELKQKVLTCHLLFNLFFFCKKKFIMKNLRQKTVKFFIKKITRKNFIIKIKTEKFYTKKYPTKEKILSLKNNDKKFRHKKFPQNKRKVISLK